MTALLGLVGRCKPFINCSQKLCSSLSFRFCLVIQLLAYQRATEFKEWILSAWIVDNPKVLDDIVMFSCGVQHIDLVLELLVG